MYNRYSVMVKNTLAMQGTVFVFIWFFFELAYISICNHCLYLEPQFLRVHKGVKVSKLLLASIKKYAFNWNRTFTLSGGTLNFMVLHTQISLFNHGSSGNEMWFFFDITQRNPFGTYHKKLVHFFQEGANKCSLGWCNRRTTSGSLKACLLLPARMRLT